MEKRDDFITIAKSLILFLTFSYSVEFNGLSNKDFYRFLNITIYHAVYTMYTSLNSLQLTQKNNKRVVSIFAHGTSLI